MKKWNNKKYTEEDSQWQCHNGDKAMTMMVLIAHYLFDLMTRIGNNKNGKDDRVNGGDRSYDIYQKYDITGVYHDLLVPLTPCGNPSSTVYKALKC